MPINAKVNKADFTNIIERLNVLKKPIDRETAKEIGEQVVDEMRDMISKGISPIAGNGRFPRYKDTKKYPRGKKPNTPVNLYLSGEFQDSLTYSVKNSPSGFKTEIFYGGASVNDDKESGHRKGSDGTSKTSRPTIPQGTESFAERIIRIFSKIYRDRINSI